MSHTDITRRLLLRKAGFGAVCLGAMVKPALLGASPTADGRPEVRVAADLVRTTVPHHRNAARLGAAYLRIAPQESDVAHLVNALTAGEADSEIGNDRTSRDMVRSTVRRRIKTDFERGALVQVDGWIMSVTEVRLAALAYLVRDAVPVA